MFKDTNLAAIARHANVAQFVSYAPDLTQRHSCVNGYDIDHPFATLAEAVRAMLHASPEGSVNIRSYEPDSPKSREFLYGLTDPARVVQEVSRLASGGLYTIINETVDVNDGGVSGVMLGNTLEFSPGDTPRCVEKPGTLAIERERGFDLLATVYGIDLSEHLRYGRELRVEWSLHPLPRGYANGHVIVWEVEDVGEHHAQPNTIWPNNFSRLIGDKAFGLLMADQIDLPVPTTTVVSRAIAPFTFGLDTLSAERWIRTAPKVQTPGKFSTFRGWRDPFALLQQEDPNGEFLASVLCMQGVPSEWAGAMITQADESVLIEGKPGRGDDFMLGQSEATQDVPYEIKLQLYEFYREAYRYFGPVRFEWVYDGIQVWIVQMHKGAVATIGDVIVPGDADEWVDFPVALGLEHLRGLIGQIDSRQDKTVLKGIRVLGHVGVTSHVGDVLRKAAIPSRIVREPQLV